MAEVIYMKTAKNEQKEEGDKRPHYSKTFQAKKTFTITEGKFYKNAIWLNDDGPNIKIEESDFVPKDE
tara:strand:- start:1794 stop:1997 length:204 start_codon:yes stop_codon:yes gene_type:complete